MSDDDSAGKLLPGGTPFFGSKIRPKGPHLQGGPLLYMGGLMKPPTVVAKPSIGPHVGEWMLFNEADLKLEPPLNGIDYLDIHHWTIGGMKVIHVDFAQNDDNREAEHLFVVYHQDHRLDADYPTFTSPRVLADACHMRKGDGTDQAFLDLLERSEA